MLQSSPPVEVLGSSSAGNVMPESQIVSGAASSGEHVATMVDSMESRATSSIGGVGESISDMYAARLDKSPVRT